MKNLPLLFVLTAFLLYCPGSHAEERTDSLNLKVYFRQDCTDIDLWYNNNVILIDRYVNEVKKIMADSTCRIQIIYIRSGASPEGPFDHNKELSRRRGENIRNYLQEALSLPADRFYVDAVGEDWLALKNMVKRYDVPDKEAVLRILDKYDRYINDRPTSVMGGPKKELMDLKGGTTWKWLLQNVFPDLRSAGNNITCRYTQKKDPASKPAPAPVPAPAPAPEPQRGNDTLVIIHKYVFDVDTARIADFPVKMETMIPTGINVKDSARTVISNSLIDATFAPKVEIAVPEGKNASIEVDNKVVIPQKK